MLRAIDQWKIEASGAGHDMGRVAVGYEAGPDGFRIARALRGRGIEVYVMPPASLSVERRGRRAERSVQGAPPNEPPTANAIKPELSVELS